MTWNKQTLIKMLMTAVSGAAVVGASLPARAAEPITLHALMEDVPETKIIEALLPEFEKQTGIKVEFEKIGYPDMHDKLVSQLTAPQSYYNVLEVDFLWAGEFPAAGWLADLKPFVEKSKYDLSPFIPSTLDLLGRTKDQLFLVPMYNYSMGLLYRKDLIGDEKLKAAYKTATGKELALPTTLEDYVAISKFMKANAGVAGAAMQGQRGDPNSMEFSNYLFSAGGSYLNADGKASLDTAEAKKALDLYVDNIQHGAQQGAVSATLDDTMRLMCSGSAFSMVTYWWMLPQMDDAVKCPTVAGKVGLSVMPGGHGESGGWGWGIPKNTSPEEQEAAWTFIQWVQSKDVSVKRALEGHAPVRSDVYADAAVLAKYPFYKTAQDVVATGKSFPIFTYSAQYEDLLGTQLSLAAGGQATSDAALKAASDGLQGLLDK
ncbi:MULTISPECIES: ABC transporter substrate-binding protein [Mesorhizobium]|uniref:Sugar ABC transporter substrate-binding protein n=3 Tax=Mesorhizobium TaxID=68287 RepID=A0AB38T9E9_9HYPH|nr:MULTISPECIES: sugar ABC transporter substrate-binding protein [Mesorhizobium]MDF3214376.1 sugar ABC transporter substrate-binding protein [Mesorhizobium ciceri]RUY72436.1 sugar ABC transporter substrate-binding protein [Mesorhizobium sp. M7A.F.Ca.CA.001.13.1.1]RUY72514.1 sugar ABC transporter substrate-binding protein [Mesorhizobium sp. M7A.F.Ca.CA.001.05.1.1]RUZ07491.1 sugar ABC transporter substrate-binding protein [Mesorhizobium sp. M7A.F.Ca.CA.001.04.2.1]RUZ23963.1 sugar ABC transporter